MTLKYLKPRVLSTKTIFRSPMVILDRMRVLQVQHHQALAQQPHQTLMNLEVEKLFKRLLLIQFEGVQSMPLLGNGAKVQKRGLTITKNQ